MKKQFIAPEIQIYYSRPPLDKMEKVTSANDAVPLFRSYADDRRLDYKEFFWVMLISRSNHVLGISEISVGGTSETIVNNKEIFQLALKGNASYIILCHNHPSGKLEPSSQDIQLTANLHTFGKMIGVSIIDHIIITTEGYYSLAENGQI
ncbi:MAG: hypothetical protein POELPBGB_01321 [Bacteroidia bacterium]|nr:hypothetical protein [Bacteroidia bacterium]